jgi:hypothetical protein
MSNAEGIINVETLNRFVIRHSDFVILVTS